MPKTFSRASSHLISIKTKGKQYCTELKNEKMQRNWSKYSAREKYESDLKFCLNQKPIRTPPTKYK